MTEYENGAPYADEDWDLPPEALQVKIEDIVTEIWYDSTYNVINRFSYTYRSFMYDGTQDLYKVDLSPLIHSLPPSVHVIKWILERIADNDEDAFCCLTDAVSYRGSVDD